MEPGDVMAVEAQVQQLQAEITRLQAEKADWQNQVQQAQTQLQQVLPSALRELEERKQKLQISIEQLERRQERIQKEMRSTFAGTSQDIAVRVQGFKDYLRGALQDLVASVEELPLLPAPPSAPVVAPEPTPSLRPTKAAPLKLAAETYADQVEVIEECLEQYRSQPDYYGPAWQLRRTFEPVQEERVRRWFLEQGGRGALRSLGSRLQNILVTAAVISILRQLYDIDLRVLVLANSPERLGEWRRGLQDCLGITRSDFGAEGGILLFEAAEALAQKADRLEREDLVPLIVMDEGDGTVPVGLLQFPLWLTFAPDPKKMRQRLAEDDEFDFKLF
ncbi:hypothetical protein GlitD10_0010 [Gloeomargarita lithophora Alchichica-D10]|uniref:Uncharacterized protein n=1 Tax=Gloeomargarita lithophora Alchichica-D10 TaxID=1188229 RepID=A0A1J0A8R3_9CYAN|nr:DUF3086 domain-containing protein [Gloeomargarita lithophora]APB32311.1 hypothetical protein GlitD10_0010 [Gloeomargarita lithophora Alchichica-D10]